MACTLRHSGTAYSRYLSPSRLSVNNSPPVPHPGPPASVRTHQTMTTCSAPAYRSRPILQAGNLPNLSPQHHGFKTSQRDMSGTKNRSLDMSSVMRAMGSVNLEMPKGFPLPQKLFRKTETAPERANFEQSGQKTESVSPADESFSKGNIQDSCNAPSTEASDKAEPMTLNIGAVLREQHDLLSALEHQDASVKNFCHQSPQTQSHTQQSTSKTTDNNTTKTTRENAANLVKTITNYIPGLSGDGRKDNATKAAPKKTLNKPNVMLRSTLDRKTRGVVKSLRAATSSASRLIRMEELCRHLTTYPDAKTLAVKERVVPCLLRLRASKDAGLREQAMEALALVGHTDPVKRRGIRVLSIDGGGTRGLVSIEILRRLEEACKVPIHELFDYICGVSTGCLIGILLGVHRVSLDETERLYKTFSREIFNRHKLMGVSKLVMSQAYYDAQLWEKILQDNVGTQTFLESTRDEKTPKIACVSTLMNLTKLSNFLFRNYNHAPGLQSSLPGSCKYAQWQAVRASSAAPMYYEEFKLDEWVHQDGGIITNNPTAIAVHEAKLLWPGTPLQCVVSLGTGRYEPTREPDPAGTGIRTMINKIIQSATDTEAVHTTLNDLLPPSTYYRFNPYMSEDFTLDEIRPASWDQMTLDTQLYCRKNHNKLSKAATTLMLPKMPHHRATDWVRAKVNEYR